MDNRTNHILLNKLLYNKNFNQYGTKCKVRVEDLFSFRNTGSSNYCLTLGYLIETVLNTGLITPMFFKNGGISQIELPDFERLVSDCAKLKKLDELLGKLKKEGHRVLIFCQVINHLSLDDQNDRYSRGIHD